MLQSESWYVAVGLKVAYATDRSFLAGYFLNRDRWDDLA
jgi:hypothetical protein